MIENIIEDGLNDFFFNHLCKYPEIWKLPVHFTGSVAYGFQDILKELCNTYKWELGKILRKPMDGLIAYHKSKIMEFEKTTEEQGRHRHLEKMSILELLTLMNKEDQQVPKAVGKAIPQIEKLAEHITDKMLAGGRLFYLGAGTSGRLGILDASEIPPTFGMPYGLIIGLIAGGEEAIRTPVENAEDDRNQGWLDLMRI